MTLELGILLALGCAFATNLGFLYKYRGACAAPSVDIRHPLRSARCLFASKWFAIGMSVAVGAWILHVAALAVAPISVVQAVLSGGVVLLAVMADRLFGYGVGRRQWLGVSFTAIGLLLLGVTLPASTGAHSHFSAVAMIAFEGGLVGVGALLIVGKHIGGPAEHHGVMLGAASGVLFGVSDIAIKAITGMLGHPVAGSVAAWVLVAVLASIAAFYASARGIIVFGDPLPGDAVGVVLQVAAFAIICVAAFLTPAPVRAAGQPAAAAA
jgi:hypothetical protein